jgi:hypothetical protein
MPGSNGVTDGQFAVERVNWASKCVKVFDVAIDWNSREEL